MKPFSQFLSESQAARDAYFQRIYKQAKSAGDRFPAVTAAQAGLESNWGSSLSGKNNPFGQKTTSGGTVRSTREVGSGGSYRTNARFKDYSSEFDATKYRVKTWGYKYGNAKDIDTAARNLNLPGGATIPGTKLKSHGVYATDPNYSSKVASIAKDYSSRLPKPKATPVLAKKGGVEGVGTGSSWKKKSWSGSEKVRFKAEPYVKKARDVVKAAEPYVKQAKDVAKTAEPYVKQAKDIVKPQLKKVTDLFSGKNK